MIRAVLALVTVAAFAAACGTADASSEPKAGGRSFTVAAAGDILIHPELIDQAAKDAEATGEGRAGLDFGPMLAGVEPVVSAADLAICHMETPVAGPKGPFEGYPEFLVPPQVLSTLKDVGYDTCSTASNHTFDHGMSGVRRTLDAMDEVGLGHTGSARTEKESRRIRMVEVKGVKVAHLSYSWESFVHPRPGKREWVLDVTDAEAVRSAEERAREAGAEVVILSVHWGAEYFNEPSAAQVRFAEWVTEETGVDLVIGHHSHVVQPIQKVNGTWVAFSLGNQIARHSTPAGITEEGVIGWFEFRETESGWDVRARYAPTLVEVPGEEQPDVKPPADAVVDHRVIDVLAALESPQDLSEERLARYRLAEERTRGFVYNRGAPGGDGLEPLSPEGRRA
ncbi:CapA family protein [Streptomyces sp. NPDC002734]|uniref:CapA family protein n=1 Tax=Streptomyces sp. NPDC002734 TaxID=3154426 RepID=UPI00331DD769